MVQMNDANANGIFRRLIVHHFLQKRRLRCFAAKKNTADCNYSKAENLMNGLVFFGRTKESPTSI
jgi:hypothetical protein